MEIDVFEKEINKIMSKDDETDLFDDELSFKIAADGCLSAKFNQESIRTEGRPWKESLDIIIEFIKGKYNEKYCRS